MTAGNAALIEQWKARAVRELPLPSGAIVRLVLPDVEPQQRRNLFPEELEQLVLRYTGGGFRLVDLSQDELRGFVQMRDVTIAESVREISFDAGATWQPIDLRDVVLQLDVVLPVEDLDTLGMAVLRKRSIEALTVDHRVRMQLKASLEGVTLEDRAEPTEAATPVAGDFRGVDPDAGSSPAREDGADIRLSAV
jgi:hypothetical protein